MENGEKEEKDEALKHRIEESTKAPKDKSQEIFMKTGPFIEEKDIVVTIFLPQTF